MMGRTKQKMRTHARLARGFANALVYDVEYICLDIDNSKMEDVESSLAEAKKTIQNINSNLTKLEYALYMLKNEDL